MGGKPTAATNSTAQPSASAPLSSPIHGSGSAAPSGAPSGGTCPLRKILGPGLSSLIFNSAGHIQCPAPIIQARAALAATPPIKSLRPQALPVKFLAVGAIAMALNVPCGMWREHTEKFSSQVSHGFADEKIPPQFINIAILNRAVPIHLH